MPLKALVQRDKDSDIPVFVSNAIQFLMDNALSMEGIFRKSGLQTDIEALKYLVDSGAPLNWTGGDKRVGPNNIAGLLKLWFREMPEPLLTYGLYDHFMQMLTLESDRVPYLKTLVDRLPPENRNLLQHLFKMLVAVTKHQDKNLMSAKNLAIVFGPNLLKPKPENNPGRLLENSLEISPIEDGLMDPTSLAKVAAVTEVMLSNYDQIFNTVEEERRQKKEELKAQQDEKLKVQKEKQEQTSTQLQKATIVMEQGIKQKQKDKKNAAVPALGAVAYQGYLKWKGKKSWSSYYFVLKYKSLSFFKNPKDVKPKGRITLCNCMLGATTEKPFCFALRTNDRAFLFAAKNKQDMDKWMGAISSCTETTDSDVFKFEDMEDSEEE